VPPSCPAMGQAFPAAAELAVSSRAPEGTPELGPQTGSDKLHT